MAFKFQSGMKIYDVVWERDGEMLHARGRRGWSHRPRLSQLTFATKSAPLRHADPYWVCLPMEKSGSDQHQVERRD